MTALELRNKYLNFFQTKGHTKIAGKSLIPENDPTVLFTTAGMHPLVPYILGEPHPAGKRLVNHQKCIRTVDIENVGDTSHITFFEMLGNWSLGDYFRKEAIEYSFEFLTSQDWLAFPAELLSVTVYEGDQNVPRDEESARIWRSLGIPDDRIYYLPKKDNWWGPPGLTGPCGPDTEMFIDTGNPPCSDNCRPGCSCGKYFEIWNDVFMEYNKTGDGKLRPLAMKTVDTGMGVERTVAMIQGKVSVYQTELFLPIIRTIEESAGKAYGQNELLDTSFRIVADHLRSSCFILGDDYGVNPSNLGQGYILRRLIRRAIRHGRKLGLEDDLFRKIGSVTIDLYREAYPELGSNSAKILSELTLEVERFGNTLKKGEHEFAKLVPDLIKNPKKIIPGRIAFRLYDTFGFPLEMTEELGAEYGLTVDYDGFREAFQRHKNLSKMGSEKIFKGGLADHSDMVTKLHTATHLLHQALRIVLGEHVMQRGSNITNERLRFDFSHHQKMTSEEIKKVEEIVNEQIKRKLDVSYKTVTLEEAQREGAIALFGQKYEDNVKVYSIDDFSKEVCGGPHVENTDSLGRFRIKKEQSSSAGTRRIRAVLEGE